MYRNKTKFYIQLETIVDMFTPKRTGVVVFTAGAHFFQLEFLKIPNESKIGQKYLSNHSYFRFLDST